MLDILFYGWLLTLAAVYLQRNLGFANDDSYITYRYALNLADGHGLVFNPGERHFGSTAMGFAAVLGSTAWLLSKLTGLVGIVASPSALIPVIATSISAGSLAVMGIVFHRLAQRLHRPVALYLALMVVGVQLFSLFPSNSVAGHETYTFVSLLFLGSYLALFGKKGMAAGSVLAFATAIRPDSLLFLGLLVGILSLRHAQNQDDPTTRRLLIEVGAASSLFLLAWFGFVWLYFGTAIPGTLEAKQAQVVLGNWPLFTLSEAFSVLNERMPSAVWSILDTGAACKLILVVIHRMRPALKPKADGNFAFADYALLWLVFSASLLIAYRSFHVTFWFWYVYPIHFAALFFLAPSVKWVLDLVELCPSHCRWIVVSILLLVLGYYGGNRLWHETWEFMSTRNENSHITSYDPIVEYLRVNEPQGTSVATAEPGALGYKLGAKYFVIDQLGLTSPGVARAILAGDIEYPFRTWEPRYMIWSWSGKWLPRDRAWFSEQYVLVGEFAHPYWEWSLNRGAYLYRRVE